MTMPKIAFVLHASDNVATVIGGDISPGDEVMLRGVGEGSLIVSVSIPDGHKFALQDISMGGSIFNSGRSSVARRRLFAEVNMCMFTTPSRFVAAVICGR